MPTEIGFTKRNLQASSNLEIGGVPRTSIYTPTVDQQYRIGSIYREGRRKFAYARAGGVALVQALMAQGAVPSAKCTSIAQAAYAKAVGAVKVRVLVTTGGIAAGEAWTYENALQGGMMVCASVSPAVLGDVYVIAESKMYSETLIDLVLESPVRNAIGTAGELTLVMSRFSRTLVVPVTTATASAAGVPLAPVPIEYYYWSQIKGPCPMIVDSGDAITIGALAGIPAANAVAGACGAATSTLYAFPIYGRVISVAAGDKVAVIDLMID